MAAKRRKGLKSLTNNQLLALAKGEGSKKKKTKKKKCGTDLHEALSVVKRNVSLLSQYGVRLTSPTKVKRTRKTKAASPAPKRRKAKRATPKKVSKRHSKKR